MSILLAELKFPPNTPSYIKRATTRFNDLQVELRSLSIEFESKINTLNALFMGLQRVNTYFQNKKKTRKPLTAKQMKSVIKQGEIRAQIIENTKQKEELLSDDEKILLPKLCPLPVCERETFINPYFPKPHQKPAPIPNLLTASSTETDQRIEEKEQVECTETDQCIEEKEQESTETDQRIEEKEQVESAETDHHIEETEQAQSTETDQCIEEKEQESTETDQRIEETEQAQSTETDQCIEEKEQESTETDQRIEEKEQVESAETDHHIEETEQAQSTETDQCIEEKEQESTETDQRIEEKEQVESAETDHHIEETEQAQSTETDQRIEETTQQKSNIKYTERKKKIVRRTIHKILTIEQEDEAYPWQKTAAANREKSSPLSDEIEILDENSSKILSLDMKEKLYEKIQYPAELEEMIDAKAVKHGVKEFSCRDCTRNPPFKAKRKREVIRHIMIELGYFNFRCSLCDEKSNNTKSIVHHYASTHGVPTSWLHSISSTKKQ